MLSKKEKRIRHNKYNNEWAKNNKEKQRSYCRSWARKRSAFVVTLKTGKSCRFCGESNPDCLDFHHRNKNEKHTEIQRLARGTSNNNVAVLKEIAKCDLICANCHRKLHGGEQLIERSVEVNKTIKQACPRCLGKKEIRSGSGNKMFCWECEGTGYIPPKEEYLGGAGAGLAKSNVASEFNPQSMDAVVWAKEFMRLQKKFGYEEEFDEDTMRGWFANAINAGYDEATRRKEAEIARLNSELEVCRDANTQKKKEIAWLRSDLSALKGILHDTKERHKGSGFHNNRVYADLKTGEDIAEHSLEGK